MVSFDAPTNKRHGIAQLFAIHLSPRIFGYPEFETSHGFLNLGELEPFVPAQLNDGREIGDQQALGCFDKRARVTLETTVERPPLVPLGREFDLRRV